MNLKRIINWPLFLSAIVFFFLQLNVFNLGLNFRDEGFLHLNAMRIGAGEIPYRDFFLTTTPGTYYIQAFLNIFSSNYLILGRILYFFLVILILYFSDKIFRFSGFKRFFYLFLLAVIFVSPGTFAFYNIEGLLLLLISVFLFKTGIEKKNNFLFLLSGCFTSLTFLIKQSYGFWLFPVLLFLTFLILREKYLKKILFYISGVLIIAVPFLLYLLINQALDSFFYYSFIFANQVKSHRLPSVIKILFGSPLILLVFYCLSVISRNKRIIFLASFAVLAICFLLYGALMSWFELTRVYFIVFLLLGPTTIWLSRKRSKEEKNIFMAGFIFAALFLASASSGRDFTTVLIMSPLFFYLLLSLPLLLRKYLNGKTLYLNFFVLLLLAVNVFYLTLTVFNVKAIEVFQGRNQSASSNIASSKYLKISAQNENELSHIRNYTDDKQALLCFPYCPMLNVLTGKRSPSYFSFFYNETFRQQDQERTIKDLKNSKSVVVLQKTGSIEGEAGFENERLKRLIDFIKSKYELKLETENFLIYE